MRLRITLLGLLLAVMSAAACNSTEQNLNNTSREPTASVPPAPTQTGSPARVSTAPETIHADGVRRITTVELKELLAKGEAVVVDVRNEQSFKAGHIPGSRLIPVENVLAQSKSLPRNKLIVTYCS